MDKIIIALGGGDLKEKTTLKIDEEIAKLAKLHAGEKRAYGLFIGTASHDSMPAFNSFRKTYTSVFDIKADCALTVYGEMSIDKIKDKFLKADFIYVGGGDTKFMLDKWKETGLDVLIKEAYDRGVILCGRSAGAICWFKDMYTDYDIMRGESKDYKLLKGLGYLEGVCSPHYNLRRVDYQKALIENGFKEGYGLEDNGAMMFVNGEFVNTFTSGGNCYKLTVEGDKVEETAL